MATDFISTDIPNGICRLGITTSLAVMELGVGASHTGHPGDRLAAGTRYPNTVFTFVQIQ